MIDEKRLEEIRLKFPQPDTWWEACETIRALWKVARAAEQFNQRFHKWADAVGNKVQSPLDGPLAALKGD